MDKANVLPINYSLIYLALGTAKHKLSDYKEAVADYDRAINLTPSLADAYYNRGLAMHKLGNDAEAIGDFNKTLDIDPNYGLAYVGRGVSEDKLKEYESAISDWEKAIELIPAMEETLRHTITDVRNKIVDSVIGELERIS